MSVRCCYACERTLVGRIVVILVGPLNEMPLNFPSYLASKFAAREGRLDCSGCTGLKQ